MKKQPSSIHQGHRQRLRDRYTEQGPESFKDHELLEILLSYSIAQKDTNPLGHDLISQFGDLRGVFDAEPEELLKVPGIGERSAFLLKLIPGLTRRYFEELSNSSNLLSETKRQINFFVPRFFGQKQECLYAAFLDENYRLIKCELQFEGSIDAVEIHSDRILRTALKLGAKKVIIAHNHFADPCPSESDIAATRHLFYKLGDHEISLLDHIIVSEATATSMKESGHFAKATY